MKKRLKNIIVERNVHSSRMVVNTNQPVRKNPTALVNWEAVAASLVYASSTPSWGVKIRAYESQKPP